MTEEENMENAGSNDRSPKRQERKEHWEELNNSCFQKNMKDAEDRGSWQGS